MAKWAFLGLSAFGLSALLFSAAAMAADVDLKVGDAAPVFESTDDQGKTWKSTDHVGKNFVVVYFYPADCTGGCTKQAIGYTKDMDKLKEKGVEVVGVSGDSVRNHQLFKKLEHLNVTLLADEDGSVAKKFGVPAGKGGEVTKKIDGIDEVLKRGVSAKRWTFLIGKDGKIAVKNTMVNAADDSKAILKAVDELAAK